MSARDISKKFYNARLSASWLHTVIASDDGILYGFGLSKNGELGHGVAYTEFQASVLNYNIPPIAKPELVQVACGARHTLILADGNVYSSGAQDDGRLGHHQVHGMVKFPNVDKIAHISCGPDASIAVSDDGKRVYVWGRKYTTTISPEPITVLLRDSLTKQPYMSKIIAAACGTEHALVLCQDGTVWSWGIGRNGRLGHSNEVDQNHPTIIKSLIVSEDQKVVQIACGDSHNLALTAEGRVYAWGSGAYGRLGLGTEIDVNTPTLLEGPFAETRAIAVSCNSFHSAALVLPDNDDYSLYTWGGGKYGKLGHGDTINRLSPTPVQAFKKPQRAIRVSCGQHHTVVISFDNRVYVWGATANMRCGSQSDDPMFTQPSRVEYFDDKRLCTSSDMKIVEIATEDYKCKQVAVGERHSLALAVESGRDVILAWGSNSRGQMGVGKMSHSSKPIPVVLPSPSGTIITQLVCGAHFSMCLSDNGTIYVWGDNSKGQLGLGDTVSRYKPEILKALQGTNIRSIVAGFEHAAAIAHNDNQKIDDVYVWGSHEYGQLGLGTEGDMNNYPCFPSIVSYPKSLKLQSSITSKNSNQRERVSLAFGQTHSMFLLERYDRSSKKSLESRVYTCGMGAHGQLGSYANTQWTYPEPKLVSEWNLCPEDEKYIADHSSTTKSRENLRIPRVHLIAASATASIAVTNPSDIEVVYAWGYLPGLSDDPINAPTHISKLSNAEELKQELGSDLPINDFRVIKVITSKSHHMLMCKYNEKANHGRAPVVFGWGETRYGKLGVGNVVNHITQKLMESSQRQQSAADNALKKNQDDRENDKFSTVLAPELLKNFRQLRISGIASMFEHNALVTDDGEVYTWGYGEGGRLGLGDGRNINNKSESVPVVIPMFHKAERQLSRVNKRRAKQQQESQEAGGSGTGNSDAEELARKTKQLRTEFSKAYQILRSQFMKAKLEQIELIHTGILKRIQESQGNVNSLTSRHKIAKANRERRALRIRKLRMQTQNENKQNEVEMATITVTEDEDGLLRKTKQLPKDKYDSGSLVCCCFPGQHDWDPTVDVESDGEEGQDIDAMMEEQAMQQKMSFQRDLLDSCEMLATRLYMQPCLMVNAYQLVNNQVNSILQTNDLKQNTSRRKKVAAANANSKDTNDQSNVNSTAVVEKANLLRSRFSALLYNIYDLHREEDIRVYTVFLNSTLESCTRGKTQQNILVEESLEWQVFKDIFLHGKIRRQLADVLAKALSEVTPYATSDRQQYTTPAEYLEKYLVDKTTESVSEAFRLIRRKADELMTLLATEQYLTPILSIMQWPFIILCRVLRKNKIPPKEVIGRVAMKILAEVMLADQTFQFEKKRRQLQRKGFHLDDDTPDNTSTRKEGELRWTAQNALSSKISSGASSLGPSETLVLLQLKDVGTELAHDDVTDLIFYVTGRYKIPDYVMKRMKLTDGKDDSGISLYIHDLYNCIVEAIEETEIHESNGESSTYKQTQLDLLTHFLRMPFYFPRRLTQIPKNAFTLLVDHHDFCTSQEKRNILKELQFQSDVDTDRDKDTTKVNVRIDPTRCDFEYRRKSADEPCSLCHCMHPHSVTSGANRLHYENTETKKSKDVLLSFTSKDCDLMFEILCDPNFTTIIEELNGESCWQAIMAELKAWRERRIELLSEQEGSHDYEIASYTFKKLTRVSKGTRITLGESYDLVDFICDRTCVEPSLVRDKLLERDSKKRRHTDEEQRKVAALDSLKRLMDSELRTKPQLIQKMTNSFTTLMSKIEIDMEYLDRQFHINSKNTDQKTLKRFAERLKHWSKTHVVRQRGKMVTYSYQELVNAKLLYRVKPLRKYLLCMPFCCFKLWSCFHCTDKQESKLIRFLDNLTFIFLTSADPDVVNLKIIYNNTGDEKNVIIIKSVLLSLRALSSEDCSCHRIVYEPIGDDVPVMQTVVFQFSKSRLKRLLQHYPRNMRDDGAVDTDQIVDVI